MTNLEFDSQINPHLSALNDFAFKFTRDIVRADDLLQDTLIKAVQYYHKFEKGTNLRAWLFTIMRNTFINGFRRDSATALLITKIDSVSPSMLLHSANSNGGEHRFLSADIKSALSRLPDFFYAPFVRHVEGYKYHEIAQELDIPIGTVKTRIFEARKILRLSLKAYRCGA